MIGTWVCPSLGVNGQASLIKACSGIFTHGNYTPYYAWSHMRGDEQARGQSQRKKLS